MLNWLYGALFSTGLQGFKNSLTMLVFRVVIASLMFHIGWQKVTHFQDMSQHFQNVIYSSSFSLSLVIFAEVGATVFIIMGLFTRLAALTNLVSMAVATFLHYSNGEDFSLSLLYGMCFLSIVSFGPGSFSIDAFIYRKR